jgi:hypothetical protein
VNWITCTYDDDGEISNPEFVSAPDDSFWWCDSSNRLHTVLIKTGVWFKPQRIARVWHPDEVVNNECD